MIETKEIELDGSKYTITQMTARRALRMQAKLLKMFGSPLAEIILPSDGKNIKGMEFSKESAVNAIKHLCLEMNENTFESLVLELLKDVRKDGVELKESVIDLEFSGKLDVIFKLIWEILEFNYGFFFGLLKAQ
jgi:hypothetical protein